MEKPRQSIQELVQGETIQPEKIFQYEKHVRNNLIGSIDELEEFYTKKLYFQFMTCLNNYIRNHDLDPVDAACLLYSLIFPKIEHFSTLSVVQLVGFILLRLDPQESLLLISKFELKFVEESSVWICLQLCKVNNLMKAQEISAASDLLFSRIAVLLEKKIGVELYTNSYFYETCSNYFRIMKMPKDFYKSLTLYLAYTPLSEIKEKAQIAFELCVSGLIAPGMFDFAELGGNPILQCLKEDTERKWILLFVEAAMEGKWTTYQQLCNKYHTLVHKTFENHLESLNEKITLASLIELAFQQPKTNRLLSFNTIINYCEVDPKECDRLIMKALGLKLLKGSIDGVNQTFTITWVKPRLVDAERVSILKSRFVAWSENISKLINHLEKTTQEISVV